MTAGRKLPLLEDERPAIFKDILDWASASER